MSEICAAKKEGELFEIGATLNRALDNMRNVGARLIKKNAALFGPDPEKKENDCPKCVPNGAVGNLSAMAYDLLKASEEVQRQVCKIEEL